MLVGRFIGSIVPRAGTVAGAEVGTTIDGIAGDIYASNKAEKELNKDIN